VALTKITSSGIADDAIDSVHLADGGVDNAHLATGISASKLTGTLTGDVTGDVSGSAATVTGAAQSAITSLGTLTTLSVDNITINGNDISSTAGTDLTLTPLSGQQLVLDGTVIVDAGVVTGATSITSTAFVGGLTGNASTATALANARTLGGVSFDGSANINLPGVNTAGNQNTTGSAATLTTARTLGGVSFDGSANINLPGVNAAGSQNTTGSAATLTTARTLGGVSFDGSANINLPGVNAAGNQNTSGTAANLSGTPNITVGTISSGNTTTTGYLRGPASFTIDPATHGDNTGTVVIAGNLQVDGTTTTINSTTVAIDDLNFSIATDAADSAAANNAGITIGGAGATLLYTHATTSWDMNKPLNVTGNIGVSGTVDGRDVATDGTKLDTVATSANLYVHPNHSGDVVSAADGAMTIQTDAVDIAMLSATGTASSSTYLRGDNAWSTVDALPSQSGHAGKYLTTDATDASWATLDTDANTTTKGLYEHEHTIDANYSISSGSNALSAGPITIDTGYSVTVPTGSTWVIV
jgi:hypothetical protein